MRYKKMDDLQHYTVLLNPSKLKHVIPKNCGNIYTFKNKQVKSTYYSPSEG